MFFILVDEKNILMPEALKRQWEAIKMKNQRRQKGRSIYDIDGDGFEDREQCVGIHQKIKGCNSFSFISIIFCCKKIYSHDIKTTHQFQL